MNADPSTQESVLQEAMKKLFKDIAVLPNTYSFVKMEDLENSLCEFHKWAECTNLCGYREMMKYILLCETNF